MSNHTGVKGYCSEVATVPPGPGDRRSRSYKWQKGSAGELGLDHGRLERNEGQGHENLTRDGALAVPDAALSRYHLRQVTFPLRRVVWFKEMLCGKEHHSGKPGSCLPCHKGMSPEALCFSPWRHCPGCSRPVQSHPYATAV